MSVYLVSYDLRTPGRNYEDLYKMLQSVPHHHAQGSVWLIDVNNQTVVQIRDTLRTAMDTNDTLMVVRFHSQWAFQNLAATAQWLQGKPL